MSATDANSAMSVRERLERKGVVVHDHPRLVLRGVNFAVWRRDGGYVKTYEIEPEMEATFPPEDTVWRWLKQHLAGLPCRGIGMAGLELIQRRMGRGGENAQL